MAYVVKKGDNLTKIAKQNGLTLKQLLSLNKNIENPDYIQIGQKINLETKSPTGKSAYDNNDGYPTTPVKKNTPTWDRITKGAGNPATVANFNKTPEKKAPIKKQVTQKEEPGFLDSMKNKIYEIYQDAITAIDQQTSKKVVAKPKVKIDDSFIDYGYKELGTYKDQSFKAGKNDSLLSAMNVFDNDKGFDYIVSPKIKEGSKTYKNVKGVAHFLMDSDITPNQKYVDPYNEKGNKQVKSAVEGKFIPYVGTNPTDYVMYYKNIGNDKTNVKYGQLKDKDKYEGYEHMKIRSVPFSELDFNKKTDAGFLKKASYIGTLDGKQTSIITDPESNDVYGRFSGGSGIFYFKEPKTGKTISVDVSGSVNTIKQVGEELSKKYNVDPKQLQFLYHDMGSYSAKPKSHNGVLSNEQWKNYNTNNKGYSGAALMYPMEYGGQVVMENGGYAASDNVDMGYYSNPLKYFAAMGINISDDDCLECGGKIKAEDGLNPKPLIPPKPEQIDFEMERQLPPDAFYERDVRKFSWDNRDTDPEQIKLDSSYMLYKTPKGYSNVYNKGKLIGYTVDNKILIPEEPNFQNGGIVKAWIQKFSNGGNISTQDYANMQKVQAEQSVNNFNQFLQNNELGYDNPQVDLQGNPIQQKRSNPFEFQERKFESIGAPGSAGDKIQKAFSVMQAGSDAILKSVNPGQMASMMGKYGGKVYADLGMNLNGAGAMAGGTSPMSMISTAGSATSQALAAATKDDTKFGAAMQGGENARAISNTFTKNLDMLGPVGTAVKMGINGMSWVTGAIVNARKLAIQKEEEEKREKNQEYQNRNMQAVTSPYSRGVGNYKNGGSIKNLEQRLVDDIFSDYDKFMKLT